MKKLAVLLGLMLAGCNGVGETLLGVTGPTGQAGRFVQLVQTGAPAMQLSVVEAGAAGTIRLDTSRDGTQTWLTPEGASLAMRDGVLTATRGLGADMLASDVAQTLTLLRAGRPGRAQRFHTFIDGQDQAVTRSYICDLTITGPRDVSVPGNKIPALLMTEDCASSDQRFKNFYWLADGTGQIVQSRQWAGPRTGPLALRVLLR